TFLASSGLTLPLQDGKSRQPFTCAARHPHGNPHVLVRNPGDPTPPSSPVVTLHPPSREDFEGPYRNSTALCQVRRWGGSPAPEVLWWRNGSPLDEGVTTQELGTDEQGAYVTESRVVVTEEEWDAGTEYACRAEEQWRNTSKGLECG
ncbi:IGHM protein, partial [Syrrhaptes paradoxus]|nr:IGHM protein [Syrrhaptes paradoxus]